MLFCVDIHFRISPYYDEEYGAAREGISRVYRDDCRVWVVIVIRTVGEINMVDMKIYL